MNKKARLEKQISKVRKTNKGYQKKRKKDENENEMKNKKLFIIKNQKSKLTTI